MKHAERGESIVEVVVAVAIVAIATMAVLGATLSATHRFGADPVKAALQSAASRETRLAVDLLKYQGSNIAPASVATTVPLPGSSPLPVTMSITTAPTASGAVSVTVTVSTNGEPQQTASVHTTIAQPAPLPSSELRSIDAGTAPQ